MIPISLFPKRFAAALGRSRGGLSNLSFRAQSKPLSTIYTSPPPSGSTSLPAKHLEFSTVAKLQEIAEEDVITRVATLKSTIDHIEHLSSQRTQAWWTGKAPAECLGFDSRTASLHSIGQVCLAPGLISREALQNYFDNTVSERIIVFKCDLLSQILFLQMISNIL